MDEFHRKPNVVEFYVTTTTKVVVDVDAYAHGLHLSRQPNWADAEIGTTLMHEAVKREIPEDRQSLTLDEVDVYCAGELAGTYDASNPAVVDTYDIAAIVIASDAASVEIPDAFGQPLHRGTDSYQRLFVDQGDE